MDEANVQLYSVNEYIFENKEDYETALQEKKGIKYLNGQLDLNQTAKVAELYNELIEKHVFVTPIGFDYLKKLREVVAKKEPDLISSMRKIPIASANHMKKNELDKYVSGRVESQIKTMEQKVEETKSKRKISIILNIVLILMVIAMFAITMTSKNPNILNYERVIQDKYSAWAEQLSEKEKSLHQWENELERREAGLNE